MSKVFISYRRSDSADWAARLNRHLAMRFGNDLIFQDVEDIPLGHNWLDAIRRELASCRVFLIVIGPRWLVDAGGRPRLDGPGDVLRMEICEALSSGGTVIPVLVGQATMPSSNELPEPVRPLLMRQGAQLRDDQWLVDVEALIEQLRGIILVATGQIPLPYAKQELYDMQVQYFDLLEHGNTAAALEKAQKTQTYLNQVLPLHPQDPDLKVTRGYLFKNEAMALLRLERYQEADAALHDGDSIFRTMIEERPRDAGAWNGRGSIEAVRGNFTDAHTYVDEALRILPDYPAALHDHRLILQRLGINACDVVKGS